MHAMIMEGKGIWVRIVGSGSMAITKKMRKEKQPLMRWGWHGFMFVNYRKYKTKCKKESLVCGRCKTALSGWYDVQHWWWNFLFTKNTWIRDSGASCCITNDDTVIYDVTNINESIQQNSGIMPAMKKCKLWVKVCQVNGTEQVHTLWPMKFFPQSRCKFFLWLANSCREKKLQWPLQQHSGQHFEWRYHSWLLNYDLWWLGCQSRISSQIQQWDGSIGHCPTQEKCQQSTCLTQSSIQEHHLCHC